jgi:hypothetical protein
MTKILLLKRTFAVTQVHLGLFFSAFADITAQVKIPEVVFII